MVAKSALVDVRPFQLGLAVALTGLAADARHRARRRSSATALESLVALGLGTTGATILGVLLDGRRGAVPDRREPGRDPPAHRPRGAPRAHRRVTSSARRDERSTRSRSRRARLLAAPPPVDVQQDYPDLVSDSVSGPPPSLLRARARGRRSERRRTRRRRSSTRPSRCTRSTSSPTARSLKRRSRAAGPTGEAERAGRRRARHLPRALRCRGDRDRPDLRPARHALRAAARAGNEGRQGGAT